MNDFFFFSTSFVRKVFLFFEKQKKKTFCSGLHLACVFLHCYQIGRITTVYSTMWKTQFFIFFSSVVCSNFSQFYFIHVLIAVCSSISSLHAPNFRSETFQIIIYQKNGTVCTYYIKWKLF